MINITRFRVCVTIIAFSAFTAYGAESGSGGNALRWFFASSSAVQAAKVEDAPALPQLRRSVEAGIAVFPGELLRTSFSVEGFIVDPSIPAGMVLYRGYTGLSLKSAFDFSPSVLRRGRNAVFFSLGVSAALARYTHTDLAFLEYSASFAPGVASEGGAFALRASLPVTAAFRGDAVAASAGIRLSLSRARLPHRREAGR